jgi:hypothetical protein
MVIDVPGKFSACAMCSHLFANHYQTFDGNNAGCIVAWDVRMEPAPRCECRGFAIPYRAPEGETVVAS